MFHEDTPRLVPFLRNRDTCRLIYRFDSSLRIEVDNPVCDAGRHHSGNRMALDNIRERLMLFFDLEAGVDIDCADGRYRVRIRLPFRSAKG